MATRIALFRGRFDPPGLHHVDAVKALLGAFDRVVVMPWGPMSDRATDENVAPTFRATLIDIALAGVDPRIVVDLTDIEHETITSSLEIEQKSAWAQDARVLGGGADIFHVVEAGSFAEDKARLHEGAKLVVLTPEGAAVPPGDHVVVRIAADVDGSVMRKRLYSGQPIDDLVPARVAALVARYGLYRGMPRTNTKLRIAKPRVLISVDERNTKAMAWAKRFEKYAVTEDPNLIVVFGGDGSMLHAIQQHWRKRVPFFGVNAGHLGFLLNDHNGVADSDDAVAALWDQECVMHHMPMLHIEMNTKDKGWQAGLTFNDAWMERLTGQSAWLEVKVDGHVRMPKVVCDGALVSSAAGSTAYARSMGASPLLADTPAWLFVGSNVMDPIHWKSSLLSPSSIVEVRALNVEKRPMVGYLHGVSLGEVTEMRARIARAASVELAFVSTYDMAEKIARIQFPAS